MGPNVIELHKSCNFVSLVCARRRTWKSWVWGNFHLLAPPAQALVVVAWNRFWSCLPEPPWPHLPPGSFCQWEKIYRLYNVVCIRLHKNLKLKNSLNSLWHQLRVKWIWWRWQASKEAGSFLYLIQASSSPQRLDLRSLPMSWLMATRFFFFLPSSVQIHMYAVSHLGWISLRIPLHCPSHPEVQNIFIQKT